MISKIEWTGMTWNPIVGCSIASPGCTHCYAMRMAARLEAMSATQFPQYQGTTKPSKAGSVWTGKVALAPDATLTAPLRRRKPMTYFVNSMGDLFHEYVPDAWIDRVFAVMALCPQHTFQVLTKRAARMREYMAASRASPVGLAALERTLEEHSHDPRSTIGAGVTLAGDIAHLSLWPLPNVWLGVSCEDQRRADERVPDLLSTPAAVRFVSAEPLLGPIDFTFVGTAAPEAENLRYNALTGHALPYDGVCGGIGWWATNKAAPSAKLDWIIVGGESGAGARPMHPDWARSIRDQCKGRDDALHLTGLPDTAFFFKQWGEFDPAEPHHDMRRVGKARSGRVLDGRTWDEYPPQGAAPTISFMIDGGTAP